MPADPQSAIVDPERPTGGSGTASAAARPGLDRLIGHLQAVADPTRARILNVLAAGELCVCDVVELLGLPQPTVSRHLGTLREHGWVERRQVGRFAHYRLAKVMDGKDSETEAGPMNELQRLVERLSELPELRSERRRAAESAAGRRREPC